MGRLATARAIAAPRAHGTRRRWASILRLLVAVVALGGGLLTAVPASAQGTREAGGPAYVSVVSATGLVDPIVADLLATSIDDAERAGARALVWQVDLEGSVIGGDQLVALVQRMQRARVDIAIWVGPSGSHLTGSAAFLATGADHVGMAPGTQIGLAARPVTGAGAVVASGATVTVNGEAVSAMTTTLDPAQAEAAGIAEPAPTIGDFIVDLPGVETKEVTQNGQTRREPVTAVVFSQLPIGASFMHTVASPPVAYLLLFIGLALLVFELFTAGVGVAGVVGAGCFVFACYGLATLPTHWWGLALIGFSMFAFAVDVQTGVPRVWTGIALVAFTVGSLTLYPGTDGVGLSWLTIGVGVLAMVLTFLAGMPSMVRTRFSTPTIGREWMLGELGRAVTDVSPDGVVEIRGAQWRATTNRATPIEELDRVRVVGIDGLVLEVEPEQGGARDYRER